MSIQSLNPYINFEGNAEKAIRHYERTLGAKVERLVRYREVPNSNFPRELEDKVMHCELRIGDGVVMVSDASPQMCHVGGASQVALHFSDDADLTAKFESLGQDGKT